MAKSKLKFDYIYDVVLTEMSAEGLYDSLEARRYFLDQIRLYYAYQDSTKAINRLLVDLDMEIVRINIAIALGFKTPASFYRV